MHVTASRCINQVPNQFASTIPPGSWVRGATQKEKINTVLHSLFILLKHYILPVTGDLLEDVVIGYENEEDKENGKKQCYGVRHAFYFYVCKKT